MASSPLSLSSRNSSIPPLGGYDAFSVLIPEMRNLVVSFLDPVSTMCLGLASRRFHDIVKSTFGFRSNHVWKSLERENENGTSLWELIQDEEMWLRGVTGRTRRAEVWVYDKVDHVFSPFGRIEHLFEQEMKEQEAALEAQEARMECVLLWVKEGDLEGRTAAMQSQKYRSLEKRWELEKERSDELQRCYDFAVLRVDLVRRAKKQEEDEAKAE